ncbi:MAG: arginine--tRNA ligase [Rickettsiales bacterium]|nr:arginine--tRNA ligase [Rickettsiales bacterium]
MNIYNKIKDIIIDIVKLECSNIDKDIIDSISCEQPKNQKFGDVSSNVLMILRKKNSIDVDEIKLKLISKLNKNPIFKNISFLKPGFLNFHLNEEYWYDLLNVIYNNMNYGHQNLGLGKKVLIEFVSANPTGPLHIGHVRGAIFGDVLANVLEKNGYNVTREYYVNDLGNQIDKLLGTVKLHIENFKKNRKKSLNPEMYQGEYLKEIAKEIIDDSKDYRSDDLLKKTIVKKVLNLIKLDLKSLGIKFNTFISEREIHDKGILEVILTILKNNNELYNGVLDKPKGKEIEYWTPKEQLLFKSSNYGDINDRAIKKNNGSWTYFASDIAYHHDKILRGYDELINIWGADHAGYIKRVDSAIKALRHKNVKFTVKLCQIVSLLENNKSIKMSKRTGNYILVKDIINKIGSDVIRFFMLTRKNDAHLDFDLSKALKQSKENPIFYIQYAVARINSLNNLIKEKTIVFKSFDKIIFNRFNIEELNIIKNLSLWPKVIETSVIYKEPHRLVYYLIELSAVLHNYWSMGKTNNSYKIINTDDLELMQARTILINCVGSVLRNGLETISIKPMEKM